MSQPPNYPQNVPPNYPPNYPPPGIDYGNMGDMRQRPGALTAAAVIGLVISILGILCNLVGLAGAAFQGALQRGTNQAPVPGWVAAFAGIAAVVFLAVAIAWLSVSIGLMKISGWALSFAKKLAPIHIALLVLWLGTNLILVAPESRKVAEQTLARQQAQSGKTQPPGYATGYMIGAVYGGAIITFLCAMILPVLMLILLSRKEVVAAFGGGGMYTQGMPPPM